MIDGGNISHRVRHNPTHSRKPCSRTAPIFHPNEIGDLISSPCPQYSEHPTSSRSYPYARLWRASFWYLPSASTLMSRGPPLACAGTWRVAQPDRPHLNHSGWGKVINYMSDYRLPHRVDPLDPDAWELIDVYSEAQATEDGFLVSLQGVMAVAFHGIPINRMTRHLFDALHPAVESAASGFDGGLGLAFASILRTKCSFAQGDPGNTGEIGDIYRIPPKLWLVRNEVDGWTAMYPEDY